jgi:hypothetical protein
MAFEDLQALTNQMNAAYQQGLNAYNTANPDAAAANAAKAKVANDILMTGFKIYTDKSGNTYVNSSKGEAFFVPTKDGSAPKDFTSDINEARTKVLAAVGTSGLPGLLTKLHNSGFITSTQLKSQDYISGLNDAIRQYSVNALQTYQLNEGKGGFPSMGTFLQRFTAGGGVGNLAGTKNSTQTFTTVRGRADADLNLYFQENFGRAATQAEKEDYYAEVVKAEKTNTTKTTTTTDSVGAVKNQVSQDSRLGPADYLVLQANVAKKAFPDMDVNGILSKDNKNPGKLASNINVAMKYASDYGIKITPQQALNYVGESWGTANPTDAVKTRMQQLAISTMPNLAAHIQAGGTVKDVADVYGSIKARKLGIAVPDSTADNEIMSAINLKGGMLNMADYERQLQADPRWRRTAEAHQTATEFTNTILQSFGFGGN